MLGSILTNFQSKKELVEKNIEETTFED